MNKQLGLLALGLLGVLLAAGQPAHAAPSPGPNDIQDFLPAWNADGVYVAFERTTPPFAHVLAMTSSGNDTLVVSFAGRVRGYLGSRVLVQSGSVTLVTTGSRFAAPGPVLPGIDASASPDSARVAYVRGDALYVASADGGGEHQVAAGISVPARDVIGPAWSPDGARIVVATDGGLVLANADGSGSRVLVRGDDTNPAWSPDGATVAFQQHDGAYDAIWAVSSAGTAWRPLLAGDANYRFPQFSPYSGTLAYTSDRQKVPGGATQYQFALWLRDVTGIDHKRVADVHPYSPPRWSPTGALIAVSAGQECRRWGIYVVHPTDGPARRHSNQCRFTGTPKSERVRGSYYFDLIRGLGGNDRIIALGGNDRIEGNDGSDVIEAGDGNDVVFGGDGDDRIFGGGGNDMIIGGNGRDRIDCGPGNDTVEGAGPLDRIARSCEHIRR